MKERPRALKGEVRFSVLCGAHLVASGTVNGLDDAYCILENPDTGNPNRLVFADELEAFGASGGLENVFSVQTTETIVKFGQAIQFQQTYRLVLQVDPVA